MTFANVIVNQAEKQIAKYGKTITLVRVSEGTYDRATATTTNTEVSTPIKAVIEGYRAFDIANGLAERGDLKVTLAAKGLTKPDLSDKLTIDGNTYRISEVDTVYAQDTAAIYTLHATAA